MRVMESVSAGQALFVSAVTGGPSLVWAAATDSWGAVATGAAVGTMAFMFTIWRSSNDSRFQTILDRLDKAEALADSYRDESVAAKSQNAKLAVDLAFAEAKIAKATSDGMTVDHA